MTQVMQCSTLALHLVDHGSASLAETEGYVTVIECLYQEGTNFVVNTCTARSKQIHLGDLNCSIEQASESNIHV